VCPEEREGQWGVAAPGLRNDTVCVLFCKDDGATGRTAIPSGPAFIFSAQDRHAPLVFTSVYCCINLIAKEQTTLLVVPYRDHPRPNFTFHHDMSGVLLYALLGMGGRWNGVSLAQTMASQLQGQYG